MQNKKQNKFLSWIKSPSSDILLLGIFLVLLNLVCAKSFFRLDMTGVKSYTLSESSSSLVKNLESPCEVKVFFSNNLPSPYSETSGYVRDILSEYKNAGGKNFSVEFYDMDKNESISLANEYGLKQLEIKEVKDFEVGFKSVFMGIVLTYADSIEVMDSIYSGDGFEYRFTKTLASVVSSADALSGISDEVCLTLYKTDELSKFSIAGFDGIEQNVQNAFDSVNKKYRGRLKFSVQNPSGKDAVAVEEKFGVPANTWTNPDGSEGIGVFGLVASCGEKICVVPLFLKNIYFGNVITGIEDLEDNILAAIKILTARTTDVGYTSGHGELSLSEREYGAACFAEMLSDTYALKEIGADGTIPSGVNCILINGAKESFSEKELYALDQFVMAGGNLIVFYDSFNQIQNYGQPEYVPVDCGIENLLSKYGIKTAHDYVLDERCYTEMDRQYGKMNYYFVPVLSKKSMNQKHPVTRNLGNVLFMNSSSLDVSEAEENKNSTVTVLASSSARSWTVTDNITLHPLMLYAPEDKSSEKSENLAVLVEGKFESAFDGNPFDGQTSDNSVGSNSLNSKRHLSKSIQKGKILVVSCSAVTGYSLLRDSYETPLALFLKNAVDYMNGNSDFCLMRSKTLSANMLEVKSVHAAALAKYFNEVGLALLSVVCGIIVFVKRRKHREQIRLRYNPDDTRHVAKKTSEAEGEK